MEQTDADDIATRYHWLPDSELLCIYFQVLETYRVEFHTQV